MLFRSTGAAWFTNSASGNGVTVKGGSDNGGSWNYLGKNNSDSTTFYVTDSGYIYAIGTTITAISSERRLKENITTIDPTSAWNTIKDTPYYSYNFIGMPDAGKVYGPMADEVPEEMVINTDQSDDVGVIRTFDNGMLQARSYVALKEALKKIETLEAKVAALENS